MRTNWWFFAAGLISLATAAIHALLGGPDIDAPIQASALSPVVRAVSAVVWHGATGFFALNGAALMLAAWRPCLRAAVALCVAQYLALTAIFLGFAYVRFGDVTALPQWTLFAAIVVLALLGLMQRASSEPKDACCGCTPESE